MFEVRSICCQVYGSMWPVHSGKAPEQHRKVCCHSKQDQHAFTQQGGPDISRLASNLQQQWDHAANAHLGSIDIKPQTSRKVVWICDQCPDGHLHSWSATVLNRTNGHGCPQCSGLKVCKHSSLATKAPSVAAEWDYAANDDTPDSVTAQSYQLAGWHCDACGNKWRARVSTRVSKQKAGCPQCAQRLMSQKKIQHPTIAEDPVLLAQWDHTRNAEHGHLPDKIRLKSNKKYFGSATSAQQGSSTAGLLPLMPAAAASRQAARSVLGRVLANAIPCRRSTLP